MARRTYGAMELLTLLIAVIKAVGARALLGDGEGRGLRSRDGGRGNDGGRARGRLINVLLLCSGGSSANGCRSCER